MFYKSGAVISDQFEHLNVNILVKTKNAPEALKHKINLKFFCDMGVPILGVCPLGNFSHLIPFFLKASLSSIHLTNIYARRRIIIGRFGKEIFVKVQGILPEVLRLFNSPQVVE